MRLRAKAIIVTGATTGIGRAIAQRCVAEAAGVLVHGINRPEGEELVKKLGSAAALHIDDLVDPASPARIVAAAMAAFGRIDAVVNNAAIVPRTRIHTTTVELFERTMAINVRAPIFLIQAAFPQLKANQASKQVRRRPAEGARADRPRDRRQARLKELKLDRSASGSSRTT